jgi:exopolysaccharide biosynthesis operon protein EpsL
MALAAQSSLAQQDRPVMAVVGASATWDSNVFKLAESAGRRSDRILSDYVGLRIDKPYAQQRFLLDATATAYRYRSFSNLNFNAFQYRAAWQWHLSPRVSGSVSADRSQSLANFADFRNSTQRNVITSENQNATVDGLVFGGWHLVGGVLHQESRATITFQVQSYRATGGEAGIKYLAVSGNSVAFNVRSLAGRYIDRPLDALRFIDDRFKRTESEVLANWAVTGRSALDGRLARIDYRSNRFSQRDFSGTAASASYRWTPAGKLSLNFGASRDLGPWQDDRASYRVDKRLSFGPSWQFSARAALRFSVERITTDYRQPVVAFAGPSRRDTFNVAQIGVDWKPLRNLSVNASLQRQRRTSTDATVEFNANVASGSASLMF